MDAVSDERGDLVEADIPRRFWQIAAGMHGQNAADATGGDGFLREGDTGIKAADVTDHEKARGGLRRGDEIEAFGRTRSHGLFQKDMLARSKRGEGDLVVVFPMSRDADDIDVGIGEEFAVVGDAVGDAKLGSGELEALRIAVREGDEFAARERPDRPGMDGA